MPQRTLEAEAMPKRRRAILLVENDDNDLFFFRRALASCRFQGELKVVQSMAEAIDYMEGRNSFADRSYYPLPHLIVTDFKLPGQTGVEFIRWLKKNDRYKAIPLAMFSGSALPEDKKAALTSGAQAFFAKTGEFREMCQQVEELLKMMPAVET